MKDNSKKEHSEEASQENSVNEDAFITLVAENNSRERFERISVKNEERM